MGTCTSTEQKGSDLGPSSVTSLSAAAEEFETVFGRKATSIGIAPGRVNLIGEHTDYNGGLVLPFAVNLNTAVAGAANKDDVIRVHSANKGTRVEFKTSDLAKVEKSEDEWVNYIKGVLKEFQPILAPAAKDNKKERRKSQKRKSSVGIPELPVVPEKIPGFDCVVSSTVPLGSGLSSSAALCVATVCFIEDLTKVPLTPEKRASLCHRAECNYVAEVGTMDQIASVSSRGGHLTFIDCRSSIVKHVPFNLKDHVLVVTNSGVKHSIADGKYAERRTECEKAAKALGVKTLRDATADDVEKAKEKLGDNYKRAKHVVTENARVEDAVKAVENGKAAELGKLMNESHASLRDDYEVSCKEVDFLVSTAQGVKGVVGSRITGGGFGGCIITLVEKAAAGKLMQTLEKKYKAVHKKTASSFVTEASDGAESQDLVKVETSVTKIQAIMRGNLARMDSRKDAASPKKK